MRVLFVRHAVALEREEFLEDDMLRPLSAEGKTKAAKVFGVYKQLFPKPDLIVSSEAVRAKETAELLSAAFEHTKTLITPLLNPGADFNAFKKLISSLDHKHECIAVVGHEPDFSLIIGTALTGGGILYLNVKKASCIEVELGREGRGELKSMMTPKQALKFKGKHV